MKQVFRKKPSHHHRALNCSQTSKNDDEFLYLNVQRRFEDNLIENARKMTSRILTGKFGSQDEFCQ